MSVKFGEIRNELQIQIDYRKPTWPDGKYRSTSPPAAEVEQSKQRLIKHGHVIVKVHAPREVKVSDVFF